MFNLNVFSQVALSRLVAKYFLQMGTGHFVITSSVAGINAAPYSATYCGTKFALHVSFINIGKYVSCYNLYIYFFLSYTGIF